MTTAPPRFDTAPPTTGRGPEFGWTGHYGLAADPIAVQSSPARTDRYWVAGDDILRPVGVSIEAAEGCLVAVDHETGIFGVGSSLPEALNDFREALVAHRDALESEDQLAPHLQDQLAALRRHLR